MLSVAESTLTTGTGGRTQVTSSDYQADRTDSAYISNAGLLWPSFASETMDSKAASALTTDPRETQGS